MVWSRRLAALDGGPTPFPGAPWTFPLAPDPLGCVEHPLGLREVGLLLAGSYHYGPDPEYLSGVYEVDASMVEMIARRLERAGLWGAPLDRVGPTETKAQRRAFWARLAVAVDLVQPDENGEVEDEALARLFPARPTAMGTNVRTLWLGIRVGEGIDWHPCAPPRT